MTIAGKIFTVNQGGAGCSFTISPTSANVASGSGSGTVNVSASASDCSWTAASNAGWLTINSGGSGTGNGTVGYSMSANSSSAQRSGTLTIAGQTFTVNRSGDTAPPSVTWGSPANGSTVSSTIALSATASDNIAVTRVEFYRDGNVLLGQDTASPYSLNFIPRRWRTDYTHSRPSATMPRTTARHPSLR